MPFSFTWWFETPKYGYDIENLKVMERDEYQEFLAKLAKAHPDEDWLIPATVFLRLFGIRIGEALPAEVGHFWVAEETPPIEPNLEKYGVLVKARSYLFCKCKVEKNRRLHEHVLKVPLDSKGIEPLLDFLTTHQDAPNTRLLPVSYSTIWRRYHEASDQVSPHRFKHNRLMALAMQGGSDYEIMDWGGHSDTRSSAAYTRAAGRLAGKLAERVKIE